MTLDRRTVIRELAVSAGSLAAFGKGTLEAHASSASPAAGTAKSTIRDRFWMYSCYQGFTGFPSVPGESRMTPVEAAAYFNVPNLYMATITYGKEPCKALPPVDFEPYLVSFRPLKRVVWFLSEEQSIVTDETVRTVRRLAQKYPNIVGIAVDDYFAPTVRGNPGSPLTLDEIDYLHSQLRDVGGRKLDFWVVAYRHNFEEDTENTVPKYLNRVDVITYWEAWAKDIKTLEQDFAKADRLTPGKRKLLGCYMWDFGDNKPVPLPLMQKQCWLGLEWLRKGRIEGMMFLGNFLCDRGLEAVEWTRKWVQEVGDEVL